MASFTLPWTALPPPEVVGGAVTVGNFDGVHRGHRALVAAANHWAARVGGPAVAVTFDPSPLHVLNPAAAKPPLSTHAARVHDLLAGGAAHVVTLQTDAALLSLSPEAFFEDVVVGLFGARAVVEGYNFRFGRGRSGDVALLRGLCTRAGIAFEEVPPLVVDGTAVSSSRVRAALSDGDVVEAADLLGRAYRISGTVVTGARRGRTIGFPTANLGHVQTLLPKEGVYAVRAVVGGVTHPAAANVGPNLTFGDDARKIEIHLIDFTGDLYGQEMTVEFAARLRDTKPFAGVAELVAQLEKDVAAARQILSIK
ncbi:riboflavin biosynthesis protein RibF [Fimbriiglobus ruber]|uniref:Riboflavin biosynthesis protein n=1 Tax=Fimbriiglobus ruber TaxID=1908690 RepID=A0A225DVP4_9BACT|nr:riboflavin biosynthesis protein RibF [Fimbriiglobus ruber]OWK45083.1 Riboflavin kinase [Fimbriiglobus ruber]